MTQEQAGWLTRSRSYLSEVQGEFNKITWPPQQDTINGTLAVVVIVAVIATFLGVVDYGLSQVIQQVLG